MLKLSLFFLSLIQPSFLLGLTYSPQSLEKELQSADYVGEIEVLENASETRESPLGNINTVTARLVKENRNIKITFLGGEKNERGFFFSGLPRPYVGHRYEAHLKKTADDTYKIVGFEFGLKDLNPQRRFSRNRTDGSNGDGSGAFLYWDSNYLPIPYYISEPTFRDRPELITEIDNSFATWRNIESIPIEFMAMGCSNTKYNENDGVNTVIFVTENWPFDSAAIAITRNFYVAGTSEYSGLILDSDILINGVDHQFTVGSEVGKHDIRNIVTHEIGHFLGLGHETSPVDPDATMYAVASTGEIKKQTLEADDLTGIQSAYSGESKKLSNQHSFCKVFEQNNGCRLGTTRGKRGFPLGAFICLLLVLGQIPLNRYLSKKLFKLDTE